MKRFNYFVLILSLFVCCFLMTPALNAEVFGENDLLTVTMEMNDSQTAESFYAKNNGICDITVTFTFTEFENLSADVSLPYTISVKPGDSIKILTISQVDSSKKWNFYFYYYWRPGGLNAVHDDTVIYKLPYESRTSYYIAQGYNQTFTHNGEFAYSIDWMMPVGTNILAARDGLVVDIKEGFDGAGLDESYRNKCNYVRIQHSDGTIAEYVHCKKDGVLVEVGDTVKAGDIIALSGNVGFSTDPHLHFNVYRIIDGKTMETIPTNFYYRDSEGNVVSGMLESGREYEAP